MRTRASPASSRMPTPPAFVCDSFHFGSGYTSIVTALASSTGTATNPRSGGDDGPAEGGRHAAGHQLKTVPASTIIRDSRRPERNESWSPTARPAEPAVAQFWMASDSMSTSLILRAGNGGPTVSATLCSTMASLPCGATTTNMRSGTRTRVCNGDGRPFPQALARPAQGAVDAQARL